MVNTVSRMGFNIGINLRISLVLCLYETLIKLPDIFSATYGGNPIGPLTPALYKYILTFLSLPEIYVVLFTFKVRTNEVRATYLI